MTRYYSLEALLRIAYRAIGAEPVVGDWGLLESALARQQASIFGQNAYPTLMEKAAALLHSLARNNALIDGNKRLAWHAVVTFAAFNGVEVEVDDDTAYDFVIAVATGRLTLIKDIAGQLEIWSRQS